MLQRVTIDGIELPRLYIAENKSDVALAQEKGIPYVKWSKGQDALIRIIMRPVLEKMFPHIKWNKILGTRNKFKTEVEVYECGTEVEQLELVKQLDEHEADESSTYAPQELVDEGIELEHHVDDDGFITEVADITSDERIFDGSSGLPDVIHKLSIEDYVGDISSSVNLDVLQKLRLMPAFIGDILDCIRLNVSSGLYWREGYNKRRGLAVGRYDGSRQLPNLIILDVSGSIPRGISATMISLVDTLRTQLTADLIITSDKSRYYPMGSKLPTPQELRDQFHYANESEEFFEILNTCVRGKHYGHVFSFGDNDTPYYNIFEGSLAGTTVEHVHHYHTNYQVETGYAKWCHMLAKKPEVEYDTSWCSVINRR